MMFVKEIARPSSRLVCRRATCSTKRRLVDYKKKKEEEEAWLKKWREGLAEADRIEAEKVAKHKAHEHDVKYVLGRAGRAEEAATERGRSA